MALCSVKPVECVRRDKAHSDIPLAGDFEIESESIPAPALQHAPLTFRDSLVLELSNESRLYVVRYTLNGITPSRKDPIFPRSGVNISYAINANNDLPDPKGIVIRNSGTLKLAAFGGNGGEQMSPVSTAQFHKIPHNYSIKIASNYNPQYTAGGDEGIIDGLQADENWPKG